MRLDPRGQAEASFKGDLLVVDDEGSQKGRVWLEPSEQRSLLALLLSRHRDVLDGVDRCVLETVEAHPGRAPVEIARVAGYSPSTVWPSLSRLRRLGLVDAGNRATHG